MAPLIHCVRHAQGFHNISVANLALPDPILTPFGEEQCSALAANFNLTSRISLVIASPLIRTLQTAVLSFEAALSNGRCLPTILALPSAQETSDLVSDTGSDVDYLRKICEQNGWPVDLNLVHAGWNVKTSDSKWAPTYSAISQRAREARSFIWEKVRALQDEGQESPEILFVTHGGYLHYFTEDWEDSGVERAYREGRPSEVRWDIPGTAWRNTEVRSYTIGPDGVDHDASPRLVETTESRERRGKAAHLQDRAIEQHLVQGPIRNRERESISVR